MPFADGIEQLEYAIKQKREELNFNRWINGYQHYVEYDEFRKSIEKPEEVEVKHEKVTSIFKGLKNRFG